MYLVIFGGTIDSEKNSCKFYATGRHSSKDEEHWRFADMRESPMCHSPATKPHGRLSPICLRPAASRTPELLPAAGEIRDLPWNLRGRETGLTKRNSDLGKCCLDGVKIIAAWGATVEAETKSSQTVKQKGNVGMCVVWRRPLLTNLPFLSHPPQVETPLVTAGRSHVLWMGCLHNIGAFFQKNNLTNTKIGQYN